MTAHLRKNRVAYKHREKYMQALELRRREKLSGHEIARILGLNSRTVCLWFYRKPGTEKVRILERHRAKYRQALKIRCEEKKKYFGMHTSSAEKIANMLRLKPRTVGYWFTKEKERGGEC